MTSEVKLRRSGETTPIWRAPSQTYAWFIVGYLMLLYMTNFIDRAILPLLVRPIRADLGITDTEFSYFTGLGFTVMYVIAGLPLGYIVDRASRRGTIAIGMAIWSFMVASCGLANSYGRLFFSRVGVGIGDATLNPATYSLVADIFPPNKLSKALSIYALGIPIGGGIALLAGGPFVQTMTDIGPVDLPLIGVAKPWQTVFLVIGLPGVLLAFMTMLLVPEPPRHEVSGTNKGEGKPSFRVVLAYLWEHKSVYFPLALGMSCFVLFSYGVNSWYPTFLQRNREFSIADAGLFLGIPTTLFGILGSIGAGYFADRLVARGKADGQIIVGLIYALGLMICGVGGTLIPVRWLSLTLIVCTYLFSFTWIGTAAALIQILTPNRMRGQVSVMYLFTINLLGMGLGPTFVAASTDHIFGYDEAVGYSLALIAIVFISIGMLLLQWGRKPLRELMLKREGLQLKPVTE